jgi:hypothetical protein
MFWIIALLALTAAYALRLWSESGKLVMALRIENTRVQANLEYERRVRQIVASSSEQWRERFEAERAEYHRFVDTIADRVRRGVPLVQPGASESVGEEDEVLTPTVAQADRMAVEAARREREQATKHTQVDAEESEDEARDFTGMEPIMAGDADVPPVGRVDEQEDGSGG